MAFKMRSGNGPLAFKNMGSSPMQRNFGIKSPLRHEGDGNHPMHHRGGGGTLKELDELYAYEKMKESSDEGSTEKIIKKKKLKPKEKETIGPKKPEEKVIQVPPPGTKPPGYWSRS